MNPFEILWYFFQQDQDRIASELALAKEKEENDRFLREYNQAIDREKAESDRLRKEEEDRLKKEEEDRLKKEEEDRLSTVWTAQKILEKRMKSVTT